MNKNMIVIKGHFDGKTVTVPENVQGVYPGEVIIIFGAVSDPVSESAFWLEAQEQALAKAWDDEADSVYDAL